MMSFSFLLRAHLLASFQKIHTNTHRPDNQTGNANRLLLVEFFRPTINSQIKSHRLRCRRRCRPTTHRKQRRSYYRFT